MYSHHTHSGDYVAHGLDPLEDIIAEVKRRKFRTWCMTEHAPRLEPEMLYPEEITGPDSAEKDLKALLTRFEAYMIHAKKVKERETDVDIIVGLEIEGCDEKHIEHGKSLVSNNSDVLQFMVGSVHHVHNIPIDFDQEKWNEALAVSGNNVRQLLMDYYNTQKKMLELAKPLVVGHMDLIRLYLPEDLRIDPVTGKVLEDQNSKEGVFVKDIDSLMTHWSDVKELIASNMRYIISYGGVMEINCAGFRKGRIDPFPHRDVINLGKVVAPTMRYVISDDSHGISQIGVGYDKLLDYLENVVKLDSISYLSDREDGKLRVKDISLQEVKKAEFWSIK